MKKLLISTLTALMLVGMVGCNNKVTIKVETPTIETETQKETEEEIQETTQEETQEEIQEETQEITETEIETQEEIQEETQEITEETQENVQYEYNPDWGYIPALECQFEVLPNGNFRYYKLDETTGKYYIVENPEPVETYEPVKKYKETQEKVQYEYNPDWGYDPVFDCYFEILPSTNFRYYKLDKETGKYDIVVNPEPVDCGIAEKYEPEGYQPTINYYLEPEYVESNENFVYDPFSDCYVEASQTINDTNYYKLDETNGKYKKIPNPYYNTCN